MRADVTVVGRGLIGSGAARHLAEADLDVVAIGPGEPADWESHQGPFASHYDSGRITRLTGPDPVWSELAARSIPRYREIEETSGISFYEPVGLVAVCEPDQELDTWIELAATHGAEHEVVDADEVYRRFGVRFPAGGRALIEAAPAGHIDPRKLVLAQSRAARLGGATIVEDTVTGLHRNGSEWTVEWAGGSVTWPTVIVAAGAFTNEILPEPLAFDRHPRTVLLAEVDEMVGLPSLIWHRPMPEVRVYWVPPVVYPDGRTMLKIGGQVPPDNPIGDGDELRRWFHSGGDDREVAALRGVLEQLLPDLEVRSWDQKPCVYTGTAHGRPYIGHVGDGLVVAAGGNGSGAKSSDEIGRLAADLAVTRSWRDKVLDAGDLSPVLAGRRANTGLPTG